MSKQVAWRGAKRLLALILAMAIVINGWTGYDFSVQAAETLKVTLEGFTEGARSGEYSMEYSGDTLETNAIAVTVKDDADKDVTADVRITWTKEGESVSRITDAGTYLCTAELEGETGAASLVVTPKELAIAWGDASMEYNGEIQTPSVQVGEWNVTTDSDDLPVALTTTMQDKNQGQYQAQITLKDTLNYTLSGEAVCKYTVSPMALAVDWGTLEFSYDGTAQMPNVTVGGISVDSTRAVSVGLAGDDCSVTMAVPDMTNVKSDYEVILTLAGADKANYALSGETNVYTVKAKDLKSTDITVEGLDEECFYIGSEVELSALKVLDGTKELEEGTDYEAVYSDNINVTDSAKVTISGMGNYSGTIEKTFKIVYSAEAANAEAVLSGTQLEKAAANWFSENDVLLTAPQGFKISEAQNGEWKDFLELSASDEEEQTVTYYLKKDSADASKAYISDAKTVRFYVDTTAPAVSRLEVSDADVWKQSKTISLEIDGNHIKDVYYTAGTSTEKNQVTLTENVAAIEVETYLDEIGTEYTFTITDNAGHVVTPQITVNKIDVTPPTILVKTEGEEAADVIYTNTVKTFDLICTDQEGESGIDKASLKVTKQVGDAAETEVNVSGGSFTMDEEDQNREIIYRVNVNDLSGRPAEEAAFTVIYDTTAPQITNLGLFEEENDEQFAPASENAEDVLWANQKTKTISWKVDAGDGLAGIAAIEIYKGEESDACKTLVPASAGNYEIEIEDLEYAGLYKIVVTDRAGNEKTDKQYVKVDRIPAEITGTGIEGANNGDETDTWYNASKVELSAEVSASCAGIEEVFATTTDSAEQLDNAENRLALVYTDGSCKAELTDSDFSTRTYYFYAIDEAGNITQASTTQTLKRDSQAPDAGEALISFQAKNQGASISLPDGVIAKLVTYVKNLFVRDCVEATIYVPDQDVDGVYSGVKEMVLEYADQSYTLESRTGEHAYIKEEASGYVSVGEGDEGSRVYNIFKVILPADSDGKSANINSKIAIKGLTDYAGNSCETDEQGIVVKSDAMIVVDDVAPVLNKAEYSKEQSVLEMTDEEKTAYHFYQISDDAKVQFEIEETHFDLTAEDETVSAPVYTVTPNVADSEKPVWSFADEKASAIAKFPGKSGQETEYTFTLGYKDPSGNLMVGANENTENSCDMEGTFTSDIIVIDDVAPVLTQFEIISNGGKLLLEDDGAYYAQNLAKKPDIQVLLGIEDNDTYFNEEAVAVEYSCDGITWKELESEQGWTRGSSIHSAAYDFDGTPEGEDTYQFRVTYEDRANNALILPQNNAPMVNETKGGTYTFSRPVVIDHCSPKLTKMQLTRKPVNLYSGSGADIDQKIDTINDFTSRLYYARNARVEFSVKDGYLKAEDVTVTVYQRPYKGADWDGGVKITAVSKDSTNDRTFAFEMPSDNAEYYFTVSYTDRAGNKLVYASEVASTQLQEAYQNGIRSNTDTYRSPVIVKDTTRPEYTVTYNQEPEKYNTKPVKTTLTLTEMNLDMDETEITVSAKDINGKSIEAKGLDGFTHDEAGKVYRATWRELLGEAATVPNDKSGNPDKQVLTLNLSTEANYTVTVKIADKVTKTATYTKSYCIDCTAPSITVVTEDGKSFTDTVKVQCGLLDFEKSDVTYSVINDGTFARIINKLTFGYFLQTKLVVHVKVHDTISGVASLAPTCLNEGKKEANYTLSRQKPVKGDKSVVQYDIILPMDFKGTVQMHGIDYAENKANDTGAIGMIAETAKKHAQLASNRMEVLTPYSKTPNYYAGNVDIKFTAIDGYSGFYEVNYLAGDLKETVTYPADEEICTEVSRDHTILAGNNNTNNVPFGLSFTDNAGHQEVLAEEELPIVHIDTTAPKIEVVYDNMEAENDKYYKADRTATVTITERNFDAEDTRLDISGPSAQVSGWHHVAGSGCMGGSDPGDTHHTDDCQWVATVEFHQDGDYTFTCSTTDLAGNEASYGQVDEFIIDKTLPEISVTYDNHDVRNEYYYHAPRVATVEITEHNFDPADVKIAMTAETAGKALAIPSVSAWSHSGDVHRAAIRFDYDADFTFDIEYTDLAGNQSEDYVQDEFVIDLTAPEIEIFDIEDRSANNDVVAPGIRYSDTNYDAQGTVVVMSGYNNGIVEMSGAKTVNANGVELKLDDFEHVPEMDDMYTMHATVYDLAGNSSEAEVMFSVNRFGSVYTFDEKTNALVGENGSYYTHKEPEIVVTETNVDTLEFKEITLNFNGRLKTLSEGSDFEMAASGSEESWKQYTYRINQDNFAEEGTYVLTIYSEDRAENISDNNVKGKKVEFVVDKTDPSILITGVENEKQYREQSREVTLDVEDNIRMGHVEVTLNGEVTTYTAAEIAETNGKLSFIVGSSNEWQTMKVTAFDAAGNEKETEELRFLITANIFVQFYMNKPLLYGSIVILLGAGGIWWFLAAKRKKKNEETAAN